MINLFSKPTEPDLISETSPFLLSSCYQNMPKPSSYKGRIRGEQWNAGCTKMVGSHSQMLPQAQLHFDKIHFPQNLT